MVFSTLAAWQFPWVFCGCGFDWNNHSRVSCGSKTKHWPPPRKYQHVSVLDDLWPFAVHSFSVAAPSVSEAHLTHTSAPEVCNFKSNNETSTFPAGKLIRWVSECADVNSSADPDPLRTAPLTASSCYGPELLVMRKGLGERRENTSGRFQAFCNALGHENWNPRCLNDEMVHQRDLDWGPHNWSPRGRLHPGGMINTLVSTQLLNFFIMLFLLVLCK